MCNTCQAFQDEFAEDIIRRRLRLTEGEARIVAAMWRSGIFEPHPQSNAGSVLVSRIRQHMGDDFIETVVHKGYRLSENGRSKVSEVFHQQPRSMVA